MWALNNLTPFAAERSWVRDKNGAEIWLVAVRGTFNIFPDGMLEIAEKQSDVCLAPEYSGEPGKSSLRYESDLLHTKPQTDVILHGYAYAPYGKYATQTDVAIKISSINKKLRVFGDRYWIRNSDFLGMKITKPEPFVKMSIVYERAFGGCDQKSDNPKKHSWEPRNPIGTGFAVEAKHLEGQKLPNVEHPRSLITSWDQRPAPAGFGPIAGNWQPRLQFAGTYDQKWQEEKLPLLPDDFNERFYQCSPLDQQASGYLTGGETAEIFNLTPQGYLKFRLPIVKLHFETNFGRDRIAHTANLHTVIIESDHPRLIMVWHTMLPCHTKVLKLETTTITDSEISMPCCQ
jgi:hypothetical protein